MPQDDKDAPAPTVVNCEKKWWSDKRWSDRTKCEERIDNKKNEITEKHMEMREKQVNGLVNKNNKAKELNSKEETV